MKRSIIDIVSGHFKFIVLTCFGWINLIFRKKYNPNHIHHISIHNTPLEVYIDRLIDVE